MLLGSVLILTLLSAASAPLSRLPRGIGGLLIAMVPLGLAVWFTLQVPGVVAGRGLIESAPWIPHLGVGLDFRLDGLALIFALLICFIGGGVLLYTSSYLKDHPRKGVFTATLTGFMAAMLGLVLADNMIMLFIFWELTSITSFLLIGFDDDRESARKSALQALLVTGIGGLALLAGLVLLGVAAGDFTISGALAVNVRTSPLYPAIVVLVLLGCFTKSANFPFHFWLPNAMEAPSPVSALLHSATMVKAGVYLAARLHPGLGAGPGEAVTMWNDALMVFGGATMLFGAVLATRNHALKKILAYSTVSSLGALLMLIGMDAPKAAATYLLAHAMFKGCLFLAAGSITKKTGVKDATKLRGLRKTMPFTAGACFLGGLSLAGMFPLMGFVGKELVLKAEMAVPGVAAPLVVVTLVSAILTVYAAIMVALRPLFGTPLAETLRDYPEAAGKEANWRQLATPVVLAALGLVAGIAPGLFAEPLVRMTMESIVPGSGAEELKLAAIDLLYPPTAATYLSLGVLAFGAVLYGFYHTYERMSGPIDALANVGPQRAYWGLLNGTLRLAGLSTSILQNGNLGSYVRITVGATILVAGAALLRTDYLSFVRIPRDDIMPIDVAVTGVVVVGALAALRQSSALGAVACLGGVGFMVTLVFVLFGAPDVAMTQFAVETLMVIIFVLVVWRLPRLRDLTPRRKRAWDAVVACVFGLMMGLLTYLSASIEPSSRVSEMMVSRSFTEAFGRNVVNVILVDFRAFDTLGEIFVIGVAALGVYTLLRFRVGAGLPLPSGRQADAPPAAPPDSPRAAPTTPNPTEATG